VVIAEHRAAGLDHPAERLAGLVPVAQFLGHHAEVVGDLQHERIGLAEPPLPRGIGLLEHPPSRRRIVGFLVQPGELVRRPEHPGIVLAQVDLAELDGVLEHRDGGRAITLLGKAVGTLPGRLERGGLGHPRHAAPYARRPPGLLGEIRGFVTVRDTPRATMRGTLGAV
jgi:hypothetical protein